MVNSNNAQTESHSTLDSVVGFLMRKVVIPVVAAAGIVSANGCNATGYYPASEEAKGRYSTRILPKEYHAKDGNQVDEAIDKHFKFDENSAKGISQYKTPDRLKKLVDRMPGTSADVKAFNELERQNGVLYDIFKTTGIKHILIKDLKKNVDFGALQLPAEISNDQIAQTMNYIAQLKVSLDSNDLSHEARQKLEKRLGKNADFKKMVEYNTELLTLLDQMSVSQAAINHHEFQLNQIASAEDLTVKINKSMSGEDMYAHGEKVLAAIRPLPVGRFISKASPLGEEYRSFGDKTVGELYDAVMKAAEEEAADFGRGSKHILGQFHYFHLKSIGDQAHKAGTIRDEDWIALEKVMTRDFAKKVVYALPEEESVKILPTLGKAIPIIGWYFGAKSFARLLQSTTYSSGSPFVIVKAGKWEQYGAGTEYNRKDDNAQDIADTISTGTSVVITLGGAYLIYDHNRSGSSGGGSSSAGAAEIFGGETGGAGIGPK